MKTIYKPEEINNLLIDIERDALRAFEKNLAFTVEWRDNGITEKQFNSMHVWFEWCAKYLNDNKWYACAAVTGRRIPWTKERFKQDVYNVILKHWKEKRSTKDQNTSDPEHIRLALSGHLASAYDDKTITLPEWPSLRG